jgi:hypothetical protein
MRTEPKAIVALGRGALAGLSATIIGDCGIVDKFDAAGS